MPPGISSTVSGVLKPSDVLAKAADLIEPEGAWTQFALAAPAPAQSMGEADDVAVMEHDPEARCWCAMGAVWRVTPVDPPEDVKAARRAALTFLMRAMGSAVPNFNDAPGRTQAEVVAALRNASALAAEEGQ